MASNDDLLWNNTKIMNISEVLNSKLHVAHIQLGYKYIDQKVLHPKEDNH